MGDLFDMSTPDAKVLYMIASKKVPKAVEHLLRLIKKQVFESEPNLESADSPCWQTRPIKNKVVPLQHGIINP